MGKCFIADWTTMLALPRPTLSRLLTAGRPPAKHPETPKGMLTMEQIRQVLENVDLEDDPQQEQHLAA